MYERERGLNPLLSRLTPEASLQKYMEQDPQHRSHPLFTTHVRPFFVSPPLPGLRYLYICAQLVLWLQAPDRHADAGLPFAVYWSMPRQDNCRPQLRCTSPIYVLVVLTQDRTPCLCWC